jgi:hypothetical protein
MTGKRTAQIIAAVAVIAVGAWGASRALERLVAPVPVPTSTPAASVPATSVPHIVATLYYGTEDGRGLAAVQREVPLGEGVRAQGRQILEQQLVPPPPPYHSVIPAGTMVRAFYITERGDAFVDLTADVSTAHPGGATNELLTVYALVNAVTSNLASVRRVQILIGGKEADTLAGHVDLRRPLQKNLKWLPTPVPPPAEPR